ncbi:MAG TPA: NAD(P)H-dependent oxidoreductase [Desulfosporosinus sp.]
MKNILLISASPKINEQSVSKQFLEMVGSQIDGAVFNKTFMDVRKSISNHSLSEAYEALSKADVIILSFPLYVYCLPGMLTQFLQDYYNHYSASKNARKQVKVYAIVNCGFPESEINLEAIRVIKSFSQHIHAQFRFGVLIGGGPMMIAAKDAPFMKKTVQQLKDAFSSIAEDLQQEHATRTGQIISILASIPHC